MPNTSSEAIGARITAVRETRGITQAQFARLIGESPQRWGNYERGERVPPPVLLAKFWQLTGATSDFVLFGRQFGLPHELVEALKNHSAPNEKKAG